MDKFVRVVKLLVVSVVTLGLAATLAGCGDDEETTEGAGATVASTAEPSTTEATDTTEPTDTTGVTTQATTAITAATTTIEPPTTAAPATTAATPVTADTTPAGPVTISVIVGTDDATTLGERTETVPLGTDVRLELVAPSDEEYHLHGYDIEQEAPANQPVVISFTADQPGEFVLESHLTEDPLLTLVVV